GLLRRNLSALGVRLANVINIAYVGRTIVEFTVVESYTPRMIALLKLWGRTVLQDYDPSKPMDPRFVASQEAEIKQKLVHRLRRNVQTTNNQEAKRFLSDWIQTLDPSVQPSVALNSGCGNLTSQQPSLCAANSGTSEMLQHLLPVVKQKKPVAG